MSDDARAMSPATVDAYWNSGQRVTVPLPGKPECRIVFDPTRSCLSLLTSAIGKEPDVAKLRNVSFVTAIDDGIMWGEVRVDVTGTQQVAFAMLMSVANRLQLEGESLALAVPHALTAYQDLLARRQGLNDEQQRGLLGELLLLRHLLGTYGPLRAVDAWQGPHSEEHDFFFDDQHFEVKTTTSERRRHVIGGTSQLTQSLDIPLWLVSIQITAGALGAGTTLPRLVADVRSEVGDEQPEFDQRIGAMGWDDSHQDLYAVIWQLRSVPRCYRVGSHFPRITEDLLATRVPSWDLVSDVKYRIDVTNYPHPDWPDGLDGFVEAGGAQA